MKIEATQVKEITVDITPEELKKAVINCNEISVSDIVDLVRRKYLNIVTGDDRLYLRDGTWYLPGRNSAGNNAAFAGHCASEIEIEITQAIDALDAVMIMGKLKGDK